MSLIGACLRRSIDRGVRKRRRDRSSLNWHFLLKDRFPARVPASLAVGTVGPFRPRFRRESSHLVGRGQAVGSGGRSGSLYRGGQDRTRTPGQSSWRQDQGECGFPDAPERRLLAVGLLHASGYTRRWLFLRAGCGCAREDPGTLIGPGSLSPDRWVYGGAGGTTTTRR